MDYHTLTDEQYFDHMRMLFLQDGWHIFMQELNDQADIINDVQDISTLESLHFAKGQLNAIGRLLNFEAMLKRSQEESEEEEGDAGLQ